VQQNRVNAQYFTLTPELHADLYQVSPLLTQQGLGSCPNRQEHDTTTLIFISWFLVGTVS
jgi:hypothetical protein